MAFEIKECLIIPRTSAIIQSGIVRIVIRSIADCPSASVFFPYSRIVIGYSAVFFRSCIHGSCFLGYGFLFLCCFL